MPYVEPFVSCGECSSGWIDTTKGAIRCWCWKAYVQKHAVEAVKG